jgi:quaternary ammonium compound-resistance protein SugE
MTGPWANLIIAGVFERVWAVGLKYSDGFSRFGASPLTLCVWPASL